MLLRVGFDFWVGNLG